MNIQILLALDPIVNVAGSVLLSWFGPLLIIADSFLPKNVTDWLFKLVIILLICGILAFLVKKAPFIDDPWKAAIIYVLIAIPVIFVLLFLFSLL